MAVLCKCCRIFYIESNKIGFVFFCFFYDFLWIFKFSAKLFYYWSFHFTPGSLNFFADSQPCPPFTQNTLERTRETQCGPWHGGRRGSPELGGSGGALAGEEVEEDEGLTSNRFVAEDGRRSAGSWPAGRAQGARPRRALLRRTPGLGRGKVAQGGCRGSRAAARSVGLRRCWPEGVGSPTACIGRAGRRCGLRKDGRRATFIAKARRRTPDFNVLVRRPASAFVRRGAGEGPQNNARRWYSTARASRRRLTFRGGRREGNWRLAPRGSGNRACTDSEAARWPARSVRRSQVGRAPGAPAAL
jgi:hypothetical protein